MGLLPQQGGRPVSKIASATGVADSEAGPLFSGPGVLAMADWLSLFGVDSYRSDCGAGRFTLLSRALLPPTARTPKRRMIAPAVLFARALKSASSVLPGTYAVPQGLY